MIVSITVADIDANVIGTGFVDVGEPTLEYDGTPLTAEALFDHALAVGLRDGIYGTPSEAAARPGSAY
jgi:hypothetical protein